MFSHLLASLHFFWFCKKIDSWVMAISVQFMSRMGDFKFLFHLHILFCVCWFVHLFHKISLFEKSIKLVTGELEASRDQSAMGIQAELTIGVYW